MSVFALVIPPEEADNLCVPTHDEIIAAKADLSILEQSKNAVDRLTPTLKIVKWYKKAHTGTCGTVIKPSKRTSSRHHSALRPLRGLLPKILITLLSLATPILGSSLSDPHTHRLQIRTAGSISTRVVIPPEYIELRQSFAAGYVVLSFLISYAGSLCTIELLLRRTSNRGVYNVMLIVTAGICFGAVATFAMHFIGNNALTLHHPLEGATRFRPLTLAYSAGWTILSIVVSCSCMIGAFAVMGLDFNWASFGRTFGFTDSERKTSSRSRQNKDARSIDEYEDHAIDENSPGLFSNDPARAHQAQLANDISMDRLDNTILDETTPKDKSSGLSTDLKKRLKDLEFKTRMSNIRQNAKSALGRGKFDFGSSKRTSGSASNRGNDTRGRKEQWKSSNTEKKTKRLTSGREQDTGKDVSQPARQDGVDHAGNQTGNCEQETDDQDEDQEYSLAEFVAAMSDDPGDPRTSINITPQGMFPVSQHPSFSDIDDPFQTSLLAIDRRGSVPGTAEAIFAPDYVFGSLSALPMPTAPVALARENSAVGPLYPRSTMSTHLDVLPSQYYDRRSSVPNNVYGGNTGGPNLRDYELPSMTLNRIQSLPENDDADTHVGSDHVSKTRSCAEDVTAERRRDSVVKEALAQARAAHHPIIEDFCGEYSKTNVPALDYDSDKNQKRALVRTNPSGQESTDRSVKRREYKRGHQVKTSKIQKMLGLDIVTSTDVLKIIGAGTVCGCGIAGMHYIGQLSIISIPYIAYNVGNVVGSVFISVTAVIAALYIMFIIFRPKLKHGWISKGITAFVLALAVSCMHYTAMVGTHYAIKRGETPPDSARVHSGTKRTIIAICSALAFAACLGIVAFIIISQVRAISYKRNRRRVVVAAVLLDQNDRMLVWSDGVLPMADIVAVDGDASQSRLKRHISSQHWDTQSTRSSVLDVDLSIGHPAFIAALRSTWAWRQPGVYPQKQTSNTLPDFSTTLTGPPSMQSSSAESHSFTEHSADRRPSYVSMSELASFPSMTPPQLPVAMNVGKFLDRFIHSVSHLSSVITGHEGSVRRLGVLYDRVLTTGYVDLHRKGPASRQNSSLSKGQLMFLVRRVNTTHERNQLLARGFLFAEPAAVANVMSRLLAVSPRDFTNILEEQREFCDYGMISAIKPGRLYASVCIIQPTPSEGIQVICDRQARHQLPMREISVISSASSQVRSQSSEKSDFMLTGTVKEFGEAVAQLEGCTLYDLLTPRPVTADPFVERLRVSLVDNLIPMLDSLLTSRGITLVTPRLLITPCLIPLTPPPSYATAQLAPLGQAPLATTEILSATSIAWAITFKAVLAVDIDLGEDVAWEPWSLFRAQNECVMRDGRAGMTAARNAAAYTAAQHLQQQQHQQQKQQNEEDLDRARRSRVQWSINEPTNPKGNVENPTCPPSPKSMSPDVTSTGSRHVLPAIRSLAGPASPAYRRAQSVSTASLLKRGYFSADAPRRASMSGGISEEHDGLGRQSSTFEPVPEVAVGVAHWDADWLVKMLREDLGRPAYYNDDDMV